jgi:hypothetical protein
MISHGYLRFNYLVQYRNVLSFNDWLEGLLRAELDELHLFSDIEVGSKQSYRDEPGFVLERAEITFYSGEDFLRAKLALDLQNLIEQMSNQGMTVMIDQEDFRWQAIRLTK